MISPNMNLTIPTVGVTLGPAYASQVNSALSTIDAHNHANGSGVQITPAGLDINSDLAFGGNNAISLRSTRFSPQGSPLALTDDLNAVYVSGVDLYYNDGLGNQVRITDNGGIAGTPGSIANLVSPASATYVSGSQTFVWQSAANTAANMDFGSALLRNLTPSSFALTLSPPTLTTNYTITLPLLPASQTLVAIDPSGNMTAPLIDSTTISISPTIKALPGGLVDNVTTEVVSSKVAVRNAYQPVEFAALGPFGAVISSFPETTVGGLESLPYNYDIVSIFVSLGSAASAAAITFDILKNGTTVLSTLGSFAATVAGNTDSGSVFAPVVGITKPVISIPSFNAGDRMTMNIMSSGAGAANLIIKVFIKQR